jgi:predicted molibdopterin-dependent oxidoreductase YjgC
MPDQAAITIEVDGRALTASAGQTLAAALYAAGIRAWRRSRSGEPRGLLCGMGICFDCLVTVDEQPGVRACLEPVRAGMRVQTNLAGEQA